MSEDSFVRICSINNFSLQANLNKAQDRATFRVVSRSSGGIDFYYSSQLSIQDIDKDNVLYERLEDVIMQARLASSVNIATVDDYLVLELYASNQKFAQIPLRLNANASNSQINSASFSQIYDKCESSHTLSNKDIKELFKIVADNFAVLFKQRTGNPVDETVQQQKAAFILDQSDSKKSKLNKTLKKDTLPSINKEQITASFVSKLNFEKFQKQNNEQLAKLNKQLSNILSIKKEVSSLAQHYATKADIQGVLKKINNIDDVYSNLPKEVGQAVKSILDQTDINGLKSRLAEFESNMKDSKSNIKIRRPNTANKEVKDKEKDKDNENQVALKWIDPHCNHFDRLTLNGDRISAKKEANVFGIKRADINYSFSIIINCLHSYIGVGVANTIYKGSPRLGQDIFKYGSNRSIFNGKEEIANQGSGFKVGDKVTVMIKNGSIEWYIYQQNKKSSEEPVKVKTNAFRENNKFWVPFIVLFSPNDDVTVFENEPQKYN